MSNLRLINETEADSVATIDITDVFSSDFDIYKIAFDFSFSNTRNVSMKFINSSGSVVTASNYDYADLQTRTDTTFTQFRSTNNTKINYLGSTTNASGTGGGTVCYVFNPTNTSSYTFLIWQNQSGYSSSLALGYKGIAVLKQLSSITGFHLTDSSTGNFTNTTVRTYGLRVDS